MLIKEKLQSQQVHGAIRYQLHLTILDLHILVL